MTPERWQQIDRIFDAVLDQPSSERESFVRYACAGDDDLRDEVLSLLKSHDESGDYISTPPLQEISELFPDENENDHSGRMIGPYRILARVAEGGMGVVYRAKRADGEYDQEVAVKLISTAHFSDEVMQRFRRERQILARLIHPNITRLLDGGRTDEGRPYLVMEYVEGTPITEYCDRHRLSITHRLRLFRKACLAVQHAHQNLIVHRDLKPGNIFVTSDGTVKLLDFGIAKILDTEIPPPESGPNTTTMIMTPEYASPEQVCGEPITTASDVYCLGVVLYQLLTGRPPYEFRNRSLAEIVRVVCEQEPALPSQVNFESQAKSIAEVREGTVEKLRARLRGDPDSIVMAALQKDPRQRYQSAELFAEEIRRHLEGKAVFARKATWFYRAGKFVSRNRAGVLAVIVLSLSILGGFLSTLRQARISEESARVNRRLAYAGQMHQAAQAWQIANIAQLDDLLDRTTPQPGEQDLRGFEWHHFWGLRNRNGELRTINHTAEVWAVACSPDNRLLAIGTDDGLVKLIDAGTGRELNVLKGHNGHVIDLAFSPDGRQLVSAGGDRQALIWDIATGRQSISLNGHTNWVTTVAFTPDGKSVVTGSRDGTVRFWDVRTGREILSLDDRMSWVSSVAVSPDGRSLATTYADSMNIQLRDLRTRRIKARFEGISLIASVQFSSDGQTLYAAGRDRKLFILDANDLRVLKELPSHSGEIKSLALSPSGRLAATASADRTVRLWNLDSGEELKRYQGHLGQVWDVAFSADGRHLISAGDDYTARVWDVMGELEAQSWKTLSGIYTFALFSPDDRLIAISFKDKIRLWDLTAKQFVSTCDLHSIVLDGPAFSPDGKRLVVSDVSGSIHICDLSSSTKVQSFKAHTARINSIAVAPDGKTFATASYDRTVIIWDMSTYQRLKTLQHKSLVSAVAYEPNGRLMATAGYDNNVRFWDPLTGRELAIMKGHTEPILSIDFSPNGAVLATGSADSTIRLWEVETGREVSIIRAHGGHVKALAFSPDGKRLATGGDDGLLRLWDVENGQEVVALYGHDDGIGRIAFSRDGKMLISSSFDSMVRLWRAGGAPTSGRHVPNAAR